MYPRVETKLRLILKRKSNFDTQLSDAEIEELRYLLLCDFTEFSTNKVNPLLKHEITITCYIALALILSLVALLLLSFASPSIVILGPAVIFAPIAVDILLKSILAVIVLASLMIIALQLVRSYFLLNINYEKILQGVIDKELVSELDHTIEKMAEAYLKGDKNNIIKYRKKASQIQSWIRSAQKHKYFLFFSKGISPKYIQSSALRIVKNKLTKRYYLAIVESGEAVEKVQSYMNIHGITELNQPSFKQIKQCVMHLEKKIYEIDQKNFHNSPQKSKRIMIERDRLLKCLGETLALKQKCWWKSIPIVGWILSPIRDSVSFLNIRPYNSDPKHYVISHRSQNLKSLCTTARKIEDIEHWKNQYLEWACLFEPLHNYNLSLSKAIKKPTRSLEYSYLLQEYAMRHLAAVLQNNHTDQAYYTSVVEKSVEKFDTKAYLRKHHLLYLKFWLTALDNTYQDAAEYTLTDELHQKLTTILPGDLLTQRAALIVALAKMEKLDPVKDEKKILADSAIEFNKNYKELTDRRAEKCIKNLKLRATSINHLNDIENLRLKELLGKSWPQKKQVDFDELGCYSPDEVHSILTQLEQSFWTYFYMLYQIGCDTKLYKTIYAYELRISKAIKESEGALSEPEKSILEILNKERTVLKKDENIDIFRDVFLPFTIFHFIFSALVSSVYNPLYGGITLCILSFVGFINNIKVKGKDDISSYLFLTAFFIGLCIVAIQLALLANVLVVNAATLVFILASIGALISFVAWVIRGAKRSINSEFYLNPRISMACGKISWLTKNLEKAIRATKKSIPRNKIFNFSISDEDLRKELGSLCKEQEIQDILNLRQQMLESEKYLTYVTSQQTNLIRTIRNTLNKDYELSIITKRCEEIAEMLQKKEISQEAAECLLRPLLVAKTTQENHTNRNLLFTSVSTVPVIVGTMSGLLGITAVSALFPPALPLILASIFLSVQISAVFSYLFIHIHEKVKGEKGFFYKKIPTPQEYLKQWQEERNPLDIPVHLVERMKKPVGLGFLGKNYIDTKKSLGSSSLGEVNKQDQLVGQAPHKNKADKNR